MNKTIKKIIAREGLIFLFVFFFGAIPLLLITWLYPDANDAPSLIFWIAVTNLAIIVLYSMYITIRFVIFGIIIRFIIWAIRTLREE